ncbi:PD40 domain-containing protein [Desulfohalovibrio reitneri]|uniref:PD40 domain-containing protein n=1 Tax=Desulfohalovibrio reitneri TaxID=1307759 RepID=UPI0004A6F1E8|nr:PD40 domain-containing protein [Desulfohalovibrio reitneri]
MQIIRLAILICLALALAVPAAARETLTIDIYGPGQTTLNMVVAPPLSGEGGQPQPLAAELRGRLLTGLSYLPFIKQVAGESILGGGAALKGATSRSIDFKRFRLSQVDLLLTQKWMGSADGSSTVELRLYEVFSGSLLTGKAYSEVRADDVNRVADAYLSAVMKTLTGRGEFFGATLAFARGEEDRTAIWSTRSTGWNAKRLISVEGKALTPNFQPDGDALAFTHVGETSHRLGIWRRDTGKTTLHPMPGNTVIGPSFTPDGRVAVTLNPRGEQNIYLLDEDYKPGKPLVESWAIDISPSFDESGGKMAFVSDRLGNPYVFMLDRDSGDSERVTYQGRYNTSPSLSPDGTLLVYSRRTPDGHRIFLHDLTTGKERQISFGPGNDEDPAFAPDGYFVAFASSRGGSYQIYLTTRHGDAPIKVETGEGEARHPTWAYGGEL